MFYKILVNFLKIEFLMENTGVELTKMVKIFVLSQNLLWNIFWQNYLFHSSKETFQQILRYFLESWFFTEKSTDADLRKMVKFCTVSKCAKTYFYLLTKSEGYSFGVVRASVRLSVRPSVHPSVRTFCLSGTISQYLLVRFNSFVVQMISTMDSWYPISLVKIEPVTLELLPLFKYRQL